MAKRMDGDESDYQFHIERTLEHNLEYHKKKTIHVRGTEDRDKLAESVLLSGGSAKNYYDSQIGKGISKVPSKDVITKVLSEYLNKDMQSTNWVTNVMHQAQVLRVSMAGKYLQGYVHDFELQFYYKIHLKKQELLRDKIYW
jgi:hypothetical protein